MIEARQALRGLYAITPDTTDGDLLLQRTEAILRGGCHLVQYRSKSPAAHVRLEHAKALLRLCRAHGALLIINDDVAMAQAIDADGVHLGRDDAPVAAARAMLGMRLVGASCYDSLANAENAQRAGADYVAFGSFFPSSVKPHAVRPPVELLKTARAKLSVPIVAIGGITSSNASALIEAGA
ncbi:MAG: thiamine phosphate synthase, partial [Proteobacteria bacterium]